METVENFTDGSRSSGSRAQDEVEPGRDTHHGSASGHVKPQTQVAFPMPRTRSRSAPWRMSAICWIRSPKQNLGFHGGEGEVGPPPSVTGAHLCSRPVLPAKPP